MDSQTTTILVLMACGLAVVLVYKMTDKPKIVYTDPQFSNVETALDFGMGFFL